MSVPNNINVITWHKKFVWIFELQVKVHSVSNDRVFQKRFIFVMWQRDLEFEWIYLTQDCKKVYNFNYWVPIIDFTHLIIKRFLSHACFQYIIRKLWWRVRCSRYTLVRRCYAFWILISFQWPIFFFRIRLGPQGLSSLSFPPQQLPFLRSIKNIVYKFWFIFYALSYFV